ncbi:unnamed protein product [Hermetia illucens]|uniref:Uncharacterized protein n=1 Tax=Hermetia illucens TaxID=343691 RepID=A0A7R8YLD5_HERIL|nr:uncharacterized protein LOC119661598 [Hermetia illucens]CAD7077430.1 unnamed protein product [Hermetia illucens]
MVQSKSFQLEKAKHQKSIRCKNPGRIVSRILGLIALAGFISWFILANIPEGKNVQTTARTAVSTEKKDSFMSDDVICNRDYCDITCIGGHVNDVATFLKNQSDSELLCYTNNKLTIYGTEFPNATLMKKWLTGDYLIASLTLKDTNLEIIEPGAFDSSCFKNLTSLEISNANIHYFPKGVLADLTLLSDLKLDSSVEDFSPEYLAGITEIITSLQVRRIPARKSPNDLFGILPLTKLNSLNLCYNNFGDTITVDTFENITPSKNLFLCGSQINSLPIGTFNSLKNGFMYLDLRNNNLTQVSAEVFEPVIPLYKLLEIKLGGNPWDCTYKLSQLAKLIEQNKRYFEGPFICDSPPELAGKNLSVSILPEPPSTTTTTEKTTTETTEETTEKTTVTSETTETTETTQSSTRTTEGSIETTTPNNSCDSKDPSLVEFTCETDVIGDDDICISDNPEAKRILRVKKMDVNFNIVKVSRGSVQITIDAIEGNSSILWFYDTSRNLKEVQNNYRNYCLGCANLDTQDFIINGLELGELYTFCMVKDNNSDTSPLNCRSYFVDYECNDQEWILQQSQMTIVAIFVAGALLTMFLGAVVMFWLIQCNPTLLKGCERIMVLNKNAKNIIVLPKDKCKGALSGEMEKTPSKRDIKRKLSTETVASSRSCDPPNYETIPYEPVATMRKDSMYFERLPKHSPPPLPKRLSEGSVSNFPGEVDKVIIAEKLTENGYLVPNSQA